MYCVFCCCHFSIITSFVLNCNFFFFFFERQQVQGGEGRRRERISSRLHTHRGARHGARAHNLIPRPEPKPRVGCLVDCGTQAPLTPCSVASHLHFQFQFGRRFVFPSFSLSAWQVLCIQWCSITSYETSEAWPEVVGCIQFLIIQGWTRCDYNHRKPFVPLPPLCWQFLSFVWLKTQTVRSKREEVHFPLGGGDYQGWSEEGFENNL